MKRRLMESMRLGTDNQKVLDASHADSRARADLKQRMNESLATGNPVAASTLAPTTGQDMATTYRIDSPDSVNHYYPAQQPPAPAPASPVTAETGSGTLGKLALGAGLVMGTAGLGLGAYGALKPAPAPITQTITTPAPEVVPWVSFDGGKTWKEQPVEK